MPPFLPKLPEIKLASPLDPLRDFLHGAREKVEKAGSDIRVLADELRSGFPGTISTVDEIKPQESLPATLPANISQEKSSTAEISNQDIATACVPCSVGHFSACAGLLNEAARFKKDGLTSNQVMDDIGKCIMELNALERVDLTPEKIQTTKGWEQPIAKEALQQSRNLRHRLEKVESMEELERIAADTQRYYTQLNRQWYQGRFRNLDPGKQEAIASRISNGN